MLQALTQVKNIPGLKENIDRNSETLFQKMLPVVVQAQESGKVASGDPVALATAYLSLVQGLALFHFQDETVSNMITPDILLNVLRK